jgi:selenocysteine lyase/cysteine desulfurase
LPGHSGARRRRPGHKVFGPTGIGVLYGKLAWLESMPPYQGGGDTISSVTFERTCCNAVPHKFELGRRTLPAPSGWQRRSST